MDIPAADQLDDTETIMAAIAHGIDGNPATGLGYLVPLVTRSPTTAVGVCAALAASSTIHTPKPADGTSFALVAVAPDGSLSDIEQWPIGYRFAAQFTAAWANNQRDTAYALFTALADSEDPAHLDGLIDGIRVLYEMAVASLSNRPDTTQES